MHRSPHRAARSAHTIAPAAPEPARPPATPGAVSGRAPAPPAAARVTCPHPAPWPARRVTEIEQAFKDLKHDLAIRPVFHQREERIEAHIFVAFIAYCLHVTLKNLARPRAPGLTPRAILEKFSTLQMVDVHLPTTDGRHLVLPRRTDPTRDQQLLLHQLNLKLPEQPPPRISA